MSPNCEAPGCVLPASWQRSPTLVVSLEEYLGDDHYDELIVERPSTAAHYEPLDGPPENTGLTPQQ